MACSCQTRVTYLAILLGLCCLLGFASPAYADDGEPHLVKDINTGTVGADIIRIVEVDDGAYVFALTETKDSTLWRVRNSGEETTGPTTICANGGNALLLSTIVFDDKLYFTCGSSIWQSDGTPEGHVLVIDFAAESAVETSELFHIVSLSGELYILRYYGAGSELWKIDGSVDNATLLTPTSAGENSSPVIHPSLTHIPSLPVIINETIFFVAADSDHGYELWKSDGTENGTQIVKDILPGSGNSGVHNLIAMKDILYFGATDGEHGYEIWQSDGTNAGTHMVQDINPMAGNAYEEPVIIAYYSKPLRMKVVEDYLYFTANDGVHGRELWRTDGTAAGTKMVIDLSVNDSTDNQLAADPLNYLIAIDDRLVFTYLSELWMTDGTAEGTSPIFTEGESPLIGATQVVAAGGQLFFVSSTKEYNRELWVSDFTPTGTKMLKDIYPGLIGSQPQLLTDSKGTLYFVANDREHGRELWKSDGTPEGTQLVYDIQTLSQGSMPQDFTTVGPEMYFAATNDLGRELWRSDGTPDGTALLKDIADGPMGSEPRSLTDVNGTLFFSASSLAYGRELWKSDGTSAGTVLVKDIAAGEVGSSPYFFVQNNDLLLFVATSNEHGTELWRSDGTAEGTFLVKDIYSGTKRSDISLLVSWNGQVYFAANDGQSGPQLWTSDGTTSGTYPLTNVDAEGSGFQPRVFLPVNDMLYIMAGRNQIWRTDGSVSGTTIFAQIEGANECGAATMAYLNGFIYFPANQGPTGCELWKSDGTENGTLLSHDINQDPTQGRYGDSSWPQQLSVIGDELYFTAYTAGNDLELWQIDGSTGRADRLINVAKPVTSHLQVWYAEETVYLWYDSNHLLTRNRLSGQIEEFPDIMLGSGSESYGGEIGENYLYFGGKLYFNGAVGNAEYELWAIDVPKAQREYLPLILIDSHSSSPR